MAIVASIFDRLDPAGPDTSNMRGGAKEQRRALIEMLCRDVRDLMNTQNLEQYLDLSLYPSVRDSVLNYGMPSLAGRSAVSVDPVELAHRVKRAFTRFEPRLKDVQVWPQQKEGESAVPQISLMIHASFESLVGEEGFEADVRIALDTGCVDVTPIGMG